MERQTENFINILNTAFTGKVLSLSEPDWKLLCQAAKSQSVIPLFTEGLSAYPEFGGAPESMKRQLLNASFGLIANQARRTEEFLSCYRAMLDAGLRPLVVKGVVCRSTYGSLADHRPSGDEDIYVKKEDFRACANVLTSLGFTSSDCSEKDFTDKLLDQLQELSFTSPSGLTIEVHINLFGKETRQRTMLSALFENVFESAVPLEIDGERTVYTMSPTMNYIFLFLHLYKHFTTAGVGIRQIADVAMFYKVYKDAIDLAEAESIIAETGADKLYADVLAVAELLGLHVPTELRGYDTEKLIADMMESGVFGGSSEAHFYSRYVTLMAVGDNDSGKSVLLKSLFPPLSLLVNGYPELSEKPWLLPYVWFKRFFKVLFGKRNVKESGEGYEIGKRRVELMREYGIIKKR